jgi:hypothetical protein
MRKGAGLRTFLLGLLVFVLVSAAIAGAGFVLDWSNLGRVGTPAHASAISNGHPEQCTNVDFGVKRRATATRQISLQVGDLLRGTFEADGGFGRVDVLMRIVSPQGEDMASSPRESNYDFMFSAKYNGNYSLVFDNRYSLYTSKSIGLYYCIEPGHSTTPSGWEPGMPPPE